MSKLAAVNWKVRFPLVTISALHIKLAHAKGEWDLGLSIKRPSTIQDRIKLVRDFMESYSHPVDVQVGVDMMNNQLEALLSAWPERYYIINKNGDKLHFITAFLAGASIDMLQRHLSNNLDLYHGVAPDVCLVEINNSSNPFSSEISGLYEECLAHKLVTKMITTRPRFFQQAHAPGLLNVINNDNLRDVTEPSVVHLTSNECDINLTGVVSFPTAKLVVLLW